VNDPLVVTGAPSVASIALPSFDVKSPDYTAAPEGTLARAAAESPLARSRRGIEVLSYRLVSTLLIDERFETAGIDHYRKLGAPGPVLRFVEDGLLLSMERERHDRVRRVLTRAFTIRRISEQRALMETVGQNLLGRFIDRGHCEAVAEFTSPYPLEVLCRFIGVPTEDIDSFAQDAQVLHLLAAVPMAPGFPRMTEAYESLERYVLHLLEERKQHPRDDFISALIEAQASEGRLSESELVGNIVNLLFAGAGTTRMQTASAIRAFVEHDWWEKLAASPDLLPGALEEALRFYPVTQFVVRIPREDSVVDGIAYPAGQRVVLNLQAASRDPDEFPEPERFDPTRNDNRSRLPFGWGVHHCIGHALARTQMTEALRLLLSNLTDVRVTSREVKDLPSAMLGGPDQLHLSFRRRPRAAGRGPSWS
jgi:cytochrome P450